MAGTQSSPSTVVANAFCTYVLLGFEVLVAVDIVKTIELTFTSLGLPAGLVVVRTFLSWTLALEIEGRWPWGREVLTEETRPASKTAP